MSKDNNKDTNVDKSSEADKPLVEVTGEPADTNEVTAKVELTDVEFTPDDPKDTPPKAEQVDEYEGKGSCTLAADNRPVFIQSDKVEINAFYTLGISETIGSITNIEKHYPNAETSPSDGVSLLMANSTVDHESWLSKEHLGELSNIITGLDKDGAVRRTAISKSKPTLNGSTLVGEEAILAITSSLGVGGKITTPLVNSGFSIRTRRLTGDDIVILDEQLLLNKGEFGRMTIGTSMGFISSYLQRDIITTLLRSVTDHNYAGIEQGDIEGLRKVIKHRDYWAMLVGALAGTNPDGLLTNIPCTSHVKDCDHVTTGNTLPSRLYHVDHEKLTARQLEIITRPMSIPVTKDDLVDYQADFITDSDYYEFTSEGKVYHFHYQQPSIQDNVNAGVKWASSINKIVNRHIASKDDPVVRKRVVRRALELNTLSQFGGWFSYIEVKNEEDGTLLARVDDQDTIIGLLKELYQLEEVGGALDNIRKFISNKDPVTIGVPNFKCPKCSATVKPKSDILVPVDIQLLFFIHTIDQQMMQNHFELTDTILY